MRKGIIVAGNMIVDHLYPTASWPNQGELVHILDGISDSTGGAVCNVIMDLAALDPTLPLYALGRVGKDADGRMILDRMNACKNIDTSAVIEEGITAFTAVMANRKTNERTFFTYMGANGCFTEADINWDAQKGDLLHIGYILLLDALDLPDDEYGTKMARLLHDAQAHGLKTSIDVVSEASDRFRRLVPPAMKYSDYCVINEVEAQQSTGIELRDAAGKLITENMPQALAAMKALGVRRWAVIHCPEGSFGMDEDNAYIARGSLILPEGYIKGSVGAGDAFCAGVLYGAEMEWTLEKSLDLGTAAAAQSLSAPGATEAMTTAENVLKLYERFGRR